MHKPKAGTEDYLLRILEVLKDVLPHDPCRKQYCKPETGVKDYVLGIWGTLKDPLP